MRQTSTRFVRLLTSYANNSTAISRQQQQQLQQTRFQSKSVSPPPPQPISQKPTSLENRQGEASVKFSPEMRMYAQRIDNLQREHSEKLETTRRRHLICGAILGAFVIGVYAYTMLAIRQEKFLDDFNVPEPPDPGYNEADKANKQPSH
jgi:hypothetical protein